MSRKNKAANTIYNNEQRCINILSTTIIKNKYTTLY